VAIDRLPRRHLEFCQWWQGRQQSARDTRGLRAIPDSPTRLTLEQATEVNSPANLRQSQAAAVGTDRRPPRQRTGLAGQRDRWGFDRALDGSLVPTWTDRAYISLITDTSDSDVPWLRAERRRFLDYLAAIAEQGALAEQHVKAGQESQRSEATNHDGDAVVAQDGLGPDHGVGHVGSDGAQDTESQRGQR
jgi:hypothetical protein